MEKYINWTNTRYSLSVEGKEPARFEGEEALKKCSEMLNNSRGVPVFFSWAGKRPYSLEGFEIASINHDHVKGKSIVSLSDNGKPIKDKLVYPCEKANIKNDEYPFMGLEVWV